MMEKPKNQPIEIITKINEEMGKTNNGSREVMDTPEKNAKSENKKNKKNTKNSGKINTDIAKELGETITPQKISISLQTDDPMKTHQLETDTVQNGQGKFVSLNDQDKQEISNQAVKPVPKNMENTNVNNYKDYVIPRIWLRLCSKTRQHTSLSRLVIPVLSSSNAKKALLKESRELETHGLEVSVSGSENATIKDIISMETSDSNQEKEKISNALNFTPSELTDIEKQKHLHAFDEANQKKNREHRKAIREIRASGFSDEVELSSGTLVMNSPSSDTAFGIKSQVPNFETSQKQPLKSWNETLVLEFILLGLSDDPHIQELLFVLFLVIYAVTVLGNVGIPLLMMVDSQLHTPMYFFLSNLSCVDLCYSTTVTPKAMANFLSDDKSISFSGCAVQLFSFYLFASSECFLLVVMAYDRYVAICNPLLYRVIMNREACVLLLSVAYSGSLLLAVSYTACTFSLPFCRSNQINHFFCEMLPLWELSCTDTSTNQVFLLVAVTALGAPSCGIILTSYGNIIRTILRIRSAEGRRKAFSTCASHTTAVSIFFGTISFMHLRQSSSFSLTQDKVVSVFYTVVIPMLNPLIYCLRNKEVKGAFWKLKSYI
ncbi:olfactory receptor 5AP2-like [Ambystoma mexicanum]|uniref:olfactory receptor 5AP2-like n=1 Tax=Ambystoma mexicanum TaxID=8296 RepID=UPI0037E873BD